MKIQLKLDKKMKKQFSIYLIFMLLGLASYATHSAEMTTFSDDKNNITFIRIEGNINLGDEQAFMKLALPLEDAVVLFNSPGGKLRPALEIGKTIYIKGFSTAVINAECSSACAIAWLAGQTRYMSRNSKIGFHAAYKKSDDGGVSEAGTGNALAGAYLNKLGFNQSVIQFVTTAPPDQIRWLTREQAEKIGLYFTTLESLEQAHNYFNQAIRVLADTPGDYEQVHLLYRLSANDGYAGAQNNLGDLYESGDGTAKNDIFAAYWYTRAAERGEPTAYLSLATLLSEKTNNQNVLTEALKFAYLAFENLPEGTNQNTAADTIKKIEAILTQDFKVTAQYLAKNWEPLYQEKLVMSDKPLR
jgi:TPR repeat protein